MKVGLVFLPAWLPYSPPLGISCMASCLKEAGHELCLFDYNSYIYQEVKEELGHMWMMPNAHYWETFNLFKTELYPKNK